VLDHSVGIQHREALLAMKSRISQGIASSNSLVCSVALMNVFSPAEKEPINYSRTKDYHS